MGESDTEPPVKDEVPDPAPSQNGVEANGDDEKQDDAVIGSAAIRPIFLGNLMPSYTIEDVTHLFDNASFRSKLEFPTTEEFREFPVDHIDVKRGFCFVFLKDAETESFKNDAEAFVKALNGM